MPVAVARRHRRPHPELRHVVLALPPDQHVEGSAQDGAFAALLLFAERYLRHAGLGVTVCALTTDADAVHEALAAAAFELRWVVERPVRTSVAADPGQRLHCPGGARV
ncbi:hypothetical protein LQ327_28520 [Actinomycetospora endophytica]|uniref:Uncharacterized protein n=1 Tax=Actinomycetospora endophytica TaxID=2291215 RepID=A0ABS8PGD0_9PSEU|nr:hypothetical protein [Actinomycetospora endophytica]MCD2197324.1 hypothetical protein [Actinomycetospora endophytica]